MFKECVHTTALTTASADDMFAHRIDSASFRGDQCVCATARALLHDRIKEGEHVNIKLFSAYYGADYSPERTFGNEISHMGAGSLIVYTVSVRDGQSEDWETKTREYLSSKGLYEMEDIEKWLGMNGTTALVFTDEAHDDKVPKSPLNNTKTVVVLKNMAMRRWHSVAILLPRLLAGFFAGRERPLTKDELKIVASLQSDSQDAFVECIKEVADSLDMRGMYIKNKLSGWETAYAKTQQAQSKRNIEQLNSQLRDYERRIGDTLRRKNELLAQMWGYTHLSEEKEPVLMNYFLANKNLVLDQVTDEQISFWDYGWFDGWDPDVADKTFRQGHMSDWLGSRNRSNGVSDEDAKMVYKALFLDEAIKVRLWSYFSLYPRGGGDFLSTGGEEKCDDITNAIPNPHHYYHHCPGNNERLINEAMMSGDVVGAIEQCICATKGINLLEDVSYEHFISDLFNEDNGEIIFINELGKFVTPRAAIDWLKNQKEEKK
jgi:hypothetical protein